MDIMVGATEDNIMMVEGEMDEVPESALLEALKVAHEAIKPMCQLQKELSKELGTDVKREYDDEINDEELRQQVKDECYAPAYAIADAGDHDKHQREEAFTKIREDFKERYAAATPNSHPTKSKKRTRSLTATTTTWNAMPCAVASSTKASVSTDVKPPTSAPSGAKCRPCPCLTVRQSLPVAKLRLWLPQHSVRNSMKRWLTMYSTRATCASSFTITSLPSQPAKLRLSVA